MSSKKDKILSTALELFSNEGYNATSTSKIAKVAEVSEGLIFRHFGNKKGLLDALNQIAEQRAAEAFMPILLETDAKEVLRKTIQLPVNGTIKEEDYSFWRLQYKLKWEPEYYNPKKMQVLIDKLTTAFQVLNYSAPHLEARFLTQTLETLSIGVLRDGLEQQLPLAQLLLSKYDLE
ncbi:MAG: helix-turn-helix domain-containing protein [Bacteroidota bacterium]